MPNTNRNDFYQTVASPSLLFNKVHFLATQPMTMNLFSMKVSVVYTSIIFILFNHISRESDFNFQAEL